MSRLEDYLWVAVHHHRHGIDVIPILGTAEQPSDEVVIDRIDASGSSFEPGEGENLEWRGPWYLLNLMGSVL